MKIYLPKCQVFLDRIHIPHAQKNVVVHYNEFKKKISCSVQWSTKSRRSPFRPRSQLSSLTHVVTSWSADVSYVDVTSAWRDAEA